MAGGWAGARMTIAGDGAEGGTGAATGAET